MANTDNFDPKSVKKLTAMEILKRVGPGIIMTGIVIGPGNITTSAMLGANYGYDMIWIIIPIILMAIIFMMVSYRISMLTGMPLLHAIRHYYGNAAAAFCGVCLFLTCFFCTMGNVSGTGAGMHLLFGIDWKIGAGIMLVVLIIVYFAKNVYSKIEIGITICIIAMIVAFYVTLVGVGGPDWGQLGHGLTHWNFNNGSLTTALAYISTNASVTAGIYGTYLGLEKKWKKEDLFNGALLADAITHVVLVVLISGAIVLVGAIVLNPTGTAIKAPAQLAELLVPIMGVAARFIMGIALVGAGFSSLLGNTQRGVVLLGAGIDKEYGLETKFVRYGCLICIVVAALICFSYGGSPTQLIFIANVLTSIATPTAGFFILRLIFRKDVNEGYGTPKVLQWGMVVCYVFACLMTISGLSTQIPNLLRSFGLIA